MSYWMRIGLWLWFLAGWTSVYGQGSNTCAGASATPMALPFNLNNQSTCGDGNDYTGSNGCVTTTLGNYYGGQDWLYAVTPTQDGYLTVNLSDIQSTGWAYPTLSLFEGCPGTPGSCMAWVQGSNWSGGATLLQQVQAGTTYYIQLDAYTWSTSYANCYQFDLQASLTTVTVQPSCTNMNFGSGNLNGWYGTTGTSITGPTNAITPTYVPDALNLVNGRQTIMTGGNDPCGGFPRVDPSGGPFSVRLGNNGTGAEAEQLMQTFAVSPTNSSFTYRYAVVFEDPGHTSPEQPFFRALLRDQNGDIIPCSDFVVSAAANLPGFFTSSTCTGVRYKPWSTVNVDLSNYLGQNVTVEFTTGDCSQGGHYGYAYIDANCAPSTLSALADTICPGQSATLTAPNGYQSYNWSPGGATSQSITVTPATSTVYTLNLVAFNGCVSQFQIPIVVAPIPVASFNFQAPACDLPVLLQNTSSITQGSIVSQNWSIPSGSPNASSQTDVNVTFPGPGPGSYPVTLSIVSDQGCTATTTQNVVVPPCEFRATITGDTLCPGACYTFTVSTNYGVPPYNYLWSNGSTANSITVCPTSNTIYTVTLTDANGDIATDTAQIVLAGDFIFQAILNNPSCNGLLDGSIEAQVQGFGPILYDWSNNDNDSLLNGVGAGNYSLNVTDRFGCPGDTAFVLSQPAPLTATATTDPSTCNLTNGEITVGQVQGGTPGYTYALNGGVPQNFPVFSNLSAGTYTINVADTNACSISLSATVTATSYPTGANFSAEAPACGIPDGEITLNSIVGGIGPYQISLNAGTPVSFTGSAIAYPNLAAGSYAFSVTDANGCALDSTLTLTMIPGPSGISLQTTPASCGIDNATLSISGVNGGSPGYTYQLNNQTVGTQTSFGQLAGGNYTVVATDQEGCTIDTLVTIAVIPDLASTAQTIESVSCFNGNDGAAQVTISAGSAPFAIVWSNAVQTALNDSLSAGTYSVVVTDSMGCTDNHTVSITEPPALSFTVQTIHPTCGENNGSLLATNTAGGTPPYAFSLAGSNFQSSPSFTQLTDSVYTLTLRDDRACEISLQTTLVMPSYPTAMQVSSIDPVCMAPNGSVSLTQITGGVPPYRYAIGDTIFQTLTAFPVTETDLDAGHYPVRILDANNCPLQLVDTLEQHPGPSALMLNTTPGTCDQPNGMLAVDSVIDGTAPFVFSFNNGSFAATSSWSNLAPEAYSVRVRDLNGCTLDTLMPILALENVSANAFILEPVTCFGYADGALQAVATSGYAPFSFAWQNGMTGEIADSLVAGTYTVTVTDSNGCVKSYSLTLNQPPPVQVDVTGPDYVCEGEPATLHLHADGGTGHLTLDWPNYSHAEETLNIQPTESQFVTGMATDEQGCYSSDSQYVLMRLRPDGEIIPDAVAGCSPMCVNFSFNQTAGDSLVSYQWNFNQQSIANNIVQKQCFYQSGTPDVGLRVTDVYGCVREVEGVGLVTIYPNPVAAFSRTPFKADIVNPEFKFFNESTDAVTFRWGFGDGSISLQENPSHTYADTGTYTACLKVTSGFGCADSTCDDVTVDPFPTIYAPNVFTPNNDEHNERFKVVVTYAKTFRLEIYDRWGELIHVSTDPEEGWDGTYKGEEVQQDVYVWKAYVTNSMNWNKELIGRVTLIE